MFENLPSPIKKSVSIFKMVSSAEGSLFVYALSYSLLLGLAPFLIIAVIVIGNYVFTVEQIVSLLTQYIPASLIEPFISYIQISNFTSLWALITLLSASVWVASKSIHSFLLNSSIRDGVVVNGIVLRTLSLVYFIFILVIIMLGGVVVSLIDIPTFFVLPILLFVFFFIFYRLLSFRVVNIKEVLLGAGFSTVAIGLVGRLFFVIINLFFNYDTIYGPFASIMILLLSLNIISQIIYIGYLIMIVNRDENADVKSGLLGRVLK